MRSEYKQINENYEFEYKIKTSSKKNQTTSYKIKKRYRLTYQSHLKI